VSPAAVPRQGQRRPASIVEVGSKEVTARVATAECTISMSREACAALIAGTPKGDPLEAAKVAGLMAAKRVPDLLPFCHPIAITGATVLVEPDQGAGTIRVEATVKASDRTGVEMESLTAAAVAALSLYDTAKAFDRAAEIGGLRLVAKSGGKSPIRSVRIVASSSTVNTCRRRWRMRARVRSRGPMNRSSFRGMSTQRPAPRLFASASMFIFRSNSSTLDDGLMSPRRKGRSNRAQIMPNPATRSQLSTSPPRGRSRSDHNMWAGTAG